MARERRRPHRHRPGGQTPAADGDLDHPRPGHQRPDVSLEPLPHERFHGVVQRRHAALRDRLPEFRGDHLRHTAQSAPGADGQLPHRHPLLLARRHLLPHAGHVWRRGHLQRHTAHAMVFPHLFRSGAQRSAALLPAHVLRVSAHLSVSCRRGGSTDEKKRSKNPFTCPETVANTSTCKVPCSNVCSPL